MARPVWAEIDLDRLAHNIKEVKRIVSDKTLITAVIKADGYGHGAKIIGKTLLENGADRFAVATFSEAMELRMAYPKTPILVLGYTMNEDFEIAEKNNIILTIFDFEQAKLINDRFNKIKLHIKINTGMNRLGFRPDCEALKSVFLMKRLDIEGIFTHFAKADEKDKTFTHHQVKEFEIALKVASDLNREIPIKHVSNSAAIIDLPEYQYDMVRAGIMLYGLYPSEEVNRQRVDLKQVLSLKARVAMTNQLKKDEGVSYGQIFKTDQARKIATLPIGYADGFTRLLTNKAQVAFGKNTTKVIGRICMDQCMIDAEGLNIEKNDIVELFGDIITIDSVAKRIGTINYEIVCMLSKRIPRSYIQSGKRVRYLDYISKPLY